MKQQSPTQRSFHHHKNARAKNKPIYTKISIQIAKIPWLFYAEQDKKSGFGPVLFRRDFSSLFFFVLDVHPYSIKRLVMIARRKKYFTYEFSYHVQLIRGPLFFFPRFTYLAAKKKHIQRKRFRVAKQLKIASLFLYSPNK